MTSAMDTDNLLIRTKYTEPHVELPHIVHELVYS